MHRFRLSTGIMAAGFATSFLMLPALADKLDGQQYLPDARVTLKMARQTALKAFPGKIESEELEKESGGSGLRYSFDMRAGDVVHEVGVDARTGVVLENSVEGTDAD